MSNYSLRKALTKDYDFLKEVHHITLQDHITKIWGWDEGQQNEFFDKDFRAGRIQVIETEDGSAGYIDLNLSSNSMHLVNILILPAFQNRGIGSKIIRELIIEAKSKNLRFHLGVFKVNTRAKSLYDYLGFVKHAETPTHYLMHIE